MEVMGMKSKWINEVQGFEHLKGYKIYDDGSVYSHLYRHNHEYIIKDTPRRKLTPFKTNKGYLKVTFGGKNTNLHRLIANAFIPNPFNKEQVNHKNGIKTDNRVENLEWVTQSENQLHSVELGLHVSLKGEQHYTNKYIDGEHHCCKKVVQLSLDDEYINTFNSIKEAALFIGVGPTNIVKCCTNVIKTTKGFKWMHLEAYESL